MSRLAARLEEWERRAVPREPRDEQTLALRVLEAADASLAEGAPAELWHRFLDLTRRPPFLKALCTRGARHRWAETTFAAIRASRYTLRTMLAQRVREHPERTLLQESPDAGAARWSYEAVERRIAGTAAALLKGRKSVPRVLILSSNSVEAACADLACLVHGIPVTPLNPETDHDSLAYVMSELRFNVILVQGEEQRARVERAGVGRARLLALDPAAPVRGAVEARVAEIVSSLTPGQVERTLESHAGLDLDQPATVMFTSGSTGLPKGVVHTGHAIVSKRFARAAALPDVGYDETLLCYLPLFHTFGRYFEMLGMLFWGGSYVFVGNPSFETLARALPEVRPTGLIGIPRRWAQLRERCLARREGGDEAVRAVVGDRLRWGLSAAGHLDPAVFRFFQRHAVELCSGFGMTEAVGGITMTPPGEYEDGSVGIPLPGMRTRLSEQGELEIAGPYVGWYLDEPEPGAGTEHWLKTGDIFVRRPTGHHEIVDRVKDVYKNTRGQTVAPAAVERRLADVPGVKRAFLVGDGRDHNVLLIVPDTEDAVISGVSAEGVDSYFGQIVAAVNRDVAPHERVVGFALLERDFEPERELTPKGSYRRKEIERGFATTIDALYRSNAVEIPCGRLRARLPRWFLRDLGVLETDVAAHAVGVVEKRSGRVLAIAARDGLVRVGDLVYELEGDVVDLGLFARQPLLWAGNPALRAFAPCKDGWDVPLARISPRVRPAAEAAPAQEPVPDPASPRDLLLEEAHALVARALFSRGETALQAVEQMAGRLPNAELRLGWLLRRRLESLAWHPDLEVRCLAYRELLLDEPLPGYGELLAAFVLSGRPFLTADSIDAIARARPEPHRLQSLRLRLRGYRHDLAWPASDPVRAVFEDLFELLCETARERPEHLVPVRAELATWALFDADPRLGAAARRHLVELAEWCRARVTVRGGPVPLHGPVSDEEARALERVLADESFLPQSVALAFDEPHARGVEVAEGGVWVTPLASTRGHRLYRVSFDGADGNHRDLLLALRDVTGAAVEETMLWMVALGDRPGATGIVPRFGCARPDLGVLSTAYVSGLSLWERVRAWVGPQEVGLAPTPLAWRSLFVRGLAAFFSAWQASDGRIVPGHLVPTNVDVPRADYLTDVRILSLAGWRPYEGPHSLVDPMRRYFLEQAAGHYPALRGKLDPLWIYEAAVEGLGVSAARAFLCDLAAAGGDVPGGAGRLQAFRERLEREYHAPLALQCAVARYEEWRRSSPKATPAARRQLVRQMLELYGLDGHGEIARYHLYRASYFASATPPVADAFDRLLRRLFERAEPATRMVELSEIQAALESVEDRRAFGEMVFPRVQTLQDAELRSTPGAARVLVLSHVTDGRGERFAVREPAGPAEVGRLYRLLSESGLAASASSRQLVLLDAEERVVGGLVWRTAAPRVAHFEGIVIAPALRSQRLAGALLEDFAARLTEAGYVAIHSCFGPEPYLVRAGLPRRPSLGRPRPLPRSGRRGGVVSRGASLHALSAGLLIALAGLAFASAGDYGIPADEPAQNRYGNRLVRWYASLGQDDSAVTHDDNRYAGGLFEIAVQTSRRVSPLGVYETRHLVNAAFGLVGVCAAWWIGVQLAGPAGGLLAALVLALTPLFWGNAFNDPRHVPFASLFTLGAAALVRTGLDRLPGPGWRVLLRLMATGVVIGLAAAVQVRGLMLLGFAALAWLVCVWEGRAGRAHPNRPLWRDLGRVGLDVGILASTAWLVMVLFWPFAQLDPIGNPFEGLQAAAAAGSDELVLYGGRLQPAGELPRLAAPWLLALKLPETYLLAGLMGLWRIVAVLLRRAPLPADTWAKLHHYGWVLSACALPLLWAAFAGAPLAEGGRSLLFVVPGLAGLAGASAAWWLRGPQRLPLRAAGGVLLALALALTARQMLRLHPFEAAYFNRLLGGGLARSGPLYGAGDRGAANRQGVDWIVRTYARTRGPQRVRVASRSDRAILAYELARSEAGRRFFEAVAPDAQPHLVLASTSCLEDERSASRVVHVVERDGFVLLKVFEVSTTGE